jgi:rRNA maturation protein Nop10
MYLYFVDYLNNSVTCKKVKVKFTLEQAMKPQRGSKRYSSTLSLTLVLDGGGLSMSCPGRFTPRKKRRYPLYRRLGGPQGQCGSVQKISPPPGFNPWTIQPVVSHYTD